MDVAAIRAEIPALAKTVYLNVGGYAPSPARVVDATVEAYRYLLENGPDVTAVRNRVRDQVAQTRAGLASLLGAAPEEIAFTRNVSEGIDVVAWGRRWEPGDEVVITDQEHPTGRIPWFNLRDRFGVVVRKLELERNGLGVLERLGGLLSERTRLVALSHVTAESGLVLPAAEMCALAHGRGVPVLLDGAQSVGQIPLDLRAMGVDYYATTGHKWLLGGFGVGALYVRRERLHELAVSWTGAGTVEQAELRRDELRWVEGARRFEFGGRLWPAYVGYGVAVDMVAGLGVGVIRAHVAGMASALKRELAAVAGVTVLSPDDPAASAGIVTFDVAGVRGDLVAAALWEGRKIVTRPALAFGRVGCRVSVAFFTTEDELAVLIDAVRGIASKGGQLSRSGWPGGGTGRSAGSA